MEDELTADFSGCPWRVEGYVYGRGVLGLHEEIVQFCQYMLPNPVEHTMRNCVVKELEDLVLSMWPEAVVEVVGSFRTGLLLPTSDLNILVYGLWEQLPLTTLSNVLLDTRFAQSDSMNIVKQSINFIHSSTKITVKISFNGHNEIRAAELIKKFKMDFPEMVPLVLVVKQFLLQRQLNQAHNGGISSYCVELMCVSFFQLHPRGCSSNSLNLGVLLLEFFELYGRRFNYRKTCISVNGQGTYCGRDIEPGDPILFIIDPFNPCNNIAKSPFGGLDAIRAFRYAYILLSKSVQPKNKAENDVTDCSILGSIVRVPDATIVYRDWIITIFGFLTQADKTSSPGEVAEEVPIKQGIQETNPVNTER